MTLKIHNTLTRKKQIFKPVHKDYVGIYSCGPTVYNYAHIGNLRTYIFNDILKRSLMFLGFKVKHVMNITDVDDKTIKSSQAKGETLKDFTRKYEDIFFEDLNELNVIKPEYVLRASESITEMVKIIQDLLKKGYAYKAEDGIYFSVSKFKDYGKLANLGKVKLSKSRISNDEYDKENARDFALWKFYDEKDGENFWNTEIGKGRPGWHIECSAMSAKILGNPFDIHTGAQDLIFPHHTNEIAQSEAASGKKFVNFWIHAGFLNMKGGKMSKSAGGILTLGELKEKGFSPLDYRYMTLTSHYRASLEFSLENLEAAKKSRERLKNLVLEFKKSDEKVNEKSIERIKKQLCIYLEDDLNIPRALAYLWELMRDDRLRDSEKYKAALEFDKIFALDLDKEEKVTIPENVKMMVSAREAARKAKDWKASDELREKIKTAGFAVDDTPEGVRVRKI